ncbi:MAG: response regulator transcription factor [Deltaproteobacteria bacterium]|nr:response regulator transcription factor [Deltaproteobacteria bacterium]MBN2845602.1 response regulator transcription factor [Deltaproteobacteria bacterium]
MNIKILVADDHKIVRDGLRTLIEKENGMEVIAEAEDGRSAVKQAKKLLPDIVIMDITMPDLNGIDATRAIFEEASGVKVIALSMHSDRRFVSGMLEAGASAYLLKDSAFEELATAIRAVVANQIYLSPKIADIVVRRFVSKSTSTERSAFTELTKREREVLQLLAEGVSTKEIAGRLNLSVKTVETHRANIMDKLDIHAISKLVKYAIREGLTSLES